MAGGAQAMSIAESGPSGPSVNGHVNGVSSSTEHKLGDFAIDEDRRLRVVVIGCGFSGICAGIRFPQRMKNVDLTIYEKHPNVGGAWHINKYPGLACDIPAHSYTFTFEPNPDWSAFFAPGPEIGRYLEGVAAKYKVMRYVKLRHEVIAATWDDLSGKWKIKVRRTSEDGREDVIDDEADIVVAGTGALSRWQWPAIKGLETFKGLRLHTANYEDGGMDYSDKSVAVIGVGSSAIQVVPALQPKTKQVDNYVRGKTWVATPFASQTLLAINPSGENYQFTAADKKRFQDPESYFAFRLELERELNSVHGATLKGHPMQEGGRVAFKEMMVKKLAKKPWIADHIIPDFPVACRRLTPGPGYLEALVADNVDFIPTHISHVTETGITTVDGKSRPYDVIVCATGYDTTYKPDIKITGRDGRDLAEQWSPDPIAYMGMATDGFPNWFNVLGPNNAVGSGSLLCIIERQIDYAVAAAKKVQRERIKRIEVKKEAVDDYDEYMRAYFPKTVYSDKCRSWYKMGKEEGRVFGLWPGSCLHALRTLERPRWEDYDYELLDGQKNRFYWLGDGWSDAEKNGNGDAAFYLHEIDQPPVPKA